MTVEERAFAEAWVVKSTPASEQGYLSCKPAITCPVVNLLLGLASNANAKRGHRKIWWLEVTFFDFFSFFKIDGNGRECINLQSDHGQVTLYSVAVSKSCWHLHRKVCDHRDQIIVFSINELCINCNSAKETW